MSTPKHYDKPVTPWDLERHMDSSGNAFVDARRTDAIEYCFRIKDSLLDDLRKAKHCIQVAIDELETQANTETATIKDEDGKVATIITQPRQWKPGWNKPEAQGNEARPKSVVLQSPAR